MEEIDNLIKRLEYRDGVLYWASGHRFGGREAGYQNPSGYIQIKYKRENKYSILAHRLIFYMFNGYLPSLVDHIDRNPRNNKIENLRDADKRINSLNRGLQSNNTTGYKGIYKVRTRSGGCKFRVRVVVFGNNYNLGTYSNIEDAIRVREEYIKNNKL